MPVGRRATRRSSMWGRLSVSLSVCLPVCLSACLPVCLSVSEVDLNVCNVFFYIFSVCASSVWMCESSQMQTTMLTSLRIVLQMPSLVSCTPYPPSLLFPSSIFTLPPFPLFFLSPLLSLPILLFLPLLHSLPFTFCSPQSFSVLHLNSGMVSECDWCTGMGMRPFNNWHVLILTGLARAKSVPTKTYSNEVVTLW